MDRGGRSRDPRSCRLLGPHLGFLFVNSHSDPRNFRRVWTLGSSWSLKSVKNHKDRASLWRDPRNCPRFRPSDPMGVFDVSTITGMVRVWSAILVAVLEFIRSDPLGVWSVSQGKRVRRGGAAPPPPRLQKK